MACRVRRDEDGLHLRYRLEGDLSSLELPRFAGLHQGERLWERSCFELFVAIAGEGAYQEWNFSPSGGWAHYGFSAYREARPPTVLVPPLHIRQTAAARSFELDVLLPAEALPPGALRCGLSSVLLDRQGHCAYWALGHPRAVPDFHDSRSFDLNL